ncbi:MAG: HAMP domain-containing histidine kinase [Cyclobacteriaceae bacterium]|nr:HAMP domain-containing histidine kinase [Cyclobacteriaceae bacterium]
MRRRNSLFFIVGAIVVLLLANIVLTFLNNRAMAENRALQQEIAIVKKEYDNIGKIVIHALDIGLRGYAVTKNPSFVTPLYDGIAIKGPVLNSLEQSLTKLGYDDSRLVHLRDSLEAYIQLCLRMKSLIDEDRFDQFKVIYERNYGNDLWGAYMRTEQQVMAYVNQVDREASDRYEAAVQKNLALQLIIFVLCVPTLLYTAVNTRQAFSTLEHLRAMEQEKYRLMEEQNQTLERKVTERTREIEQRNSGLEDEVNKRTAELQHTNEELLEQNSKLEQFAFTVAHNLRAPLTRIMGLANVIEISSRPEDQKFAIEKMVYSARELDMVIRDLNAILENARRTSQVTALPVRAVFDRVMKTLEAEVSEGSVAIAASVTDGEFKTIAPYFESILLNLVSNAIKYRDPQREAQVSISIQREDANALKIVVADNGLGIDLDKFGNNLFGLYRRFHTHVDGKGLGLYLVKSQVLAMRGKVTTQSQVGVGTTFTVVLEEMTG